MAASFTTLKEVGVGSAVIGGAAYAAGAFSAAPSTAGALTNAFYSQINENIANNVLNLDYNYSDAVNEAAKTMGEQFPNISDVAINNQANVFANALQEGTFSDSLTTIGDGVKQGVTDGLSAGGSSSGGFLSSFSGYQTWIQVVMTCLSMIGFARLEGDSVVSIQGEPATKKIGFIDAIKNLVSGIINTVKNLPKTLVDNVKGIGATTEEAVAKVSSYAVGALATAAAVGAYLSSTTGSASSTGAASTQLVQNATSVNPASTSLSNNLAAVQFYATNTSTDWLTNTPALFWSTCTSTTLVGYEWWNVQQKLASTATASYQDTLSLAIGFTDALCGITPNSGVMTIKQIIDAGSTSTNIDYAATGIIIPNIPDYAGTLYYPDYINSATLALANIILLGDTATTTLVDLQNAEITLDNSMTQLYTRITTDANNQAKYLSQARHLENVMSAANVFNSIKVSQPSDIVALYESTINPGVKDAINKLNTMMDLQSNDTSTVLTALQTIAATPIPTFNTVKLVNGVTIMGIPTTIARGRQFIVVITSGPKYGSASYTIRAPLETSGSTPLDNNGTGQFVFEFSTTLPVGTTNVDLSFSDGTTTTFAVTLV